MEIKIDKRGRITIPKDLREKYNLTHNITLYLNNENSSLTLRPAFVCCECGKALPKELYDKHACAECTPSHNKVQKIY